MKYFWRPERQRALLAELETWRGTRFFPNDPPAIKKVKADCVSFVEAVLVNVGAIRPIVWPAYVAFRGGPPMLALLKRTLADIPEFHLAWSIDGVETFASQLYIGDVLLCSSGRALHHLGIYAGQNTVWHSTEDAGGVGTANVFDPIIQKHLIAVYHIYERPENLAGRTSPWRGDPQTPRAEV